MAAIRVASASDSDLAREAIAGDGSAFAALYDRHERRAFNLAYRITGSREDAADATQEAFLKMLARLPRLADRELDFGAYLLTAVRHASYDVIARSGRAQPTEDLPETARPVGAAAARPPEEEPDRSVLLAASQEEIRAANAALAPRQREALALRELEGLSYDEIAVLLAMNRNSVAQLISRARIALRTALRRTALRTIPPASKACEKALPLIAMRDDGQLKPSDDASWLDAHLASCRRCMLGREAMAEAGASYRIWAPVAAFEALRRETIAEAGERLGHDWSEVAASRPSPHTATDREPPSSAAQARPRELLRRRVRRAGSSSGAGGVPGAAASARSRVRRDGLASSVLAVLILLAVLAVRTADGERAMPAAEPVPVAEAAVVAQPQAPARAVKAATRRKRTSHARAPQAVTQATRATAVTRAAPSARPAFVPARRPSTTRRRPARTTTAGSARKPRPVAPPPPPPATPDEPASGGTDTTTPPPPPEDPPGADVVTDPPPPPPPPPGPRTGGSGTLVAAPPPPPPPRPPRLRRPGGSGGSSVPVP